MYISTCVIMCVDRKVKVGGVRVGRDIRRWLEGYPCSEQEGRGGFWCPQ